MTWPRHAKAREDRQADAAYFDQGTIVVNIQWF